MKITSNQHKKIATTIDTSNQNTFDKTFESSFSMLSMTSVKTEDLFSESSDSRYNNILEELKLKNFDASSIRGFEWLDKFAKLAMLRSVNKESLYFNLCQSLTKRINQQDVEDWSSKFWHFKPIAGKPKAAIIFPPPNVTGNLHLGHALTGAIQDTFVRQSNMNNQRVIWTPGFDHAGLGTQLIVDNLLWNAQKVRRKDIGKEKFLNVIQNWRDKKRQEMLAQLKRLGLCLDYPNEFYTLDDERSLAVKESFKVLFKRGLILRGNRLVHWSNTLNSTLSDVEVEQIDQDGKILHKCGRTGELVDKILISQWFLDTKSAAKRAVDVVRENKIDMIPQSYKNSWSAWLTDNGTQDWCLSRQSWWGHKIPAYKYADFSDVQDNWVVADNEDEAANLLEQKFPSHSGMIQQDSDVLDTWFSSALLPISVSGWPDMEKFKARKEAGLFPLELMETGFDILNYWVTKMVMMSLVLVDEIPFKRIVLHGMICDSFGKKMSKSKGNVIDPLDIIEGLDKSKMTNEHKKMFPKSIPECAADGLRGYLLSNDLQDQVMRIQIIHLDKFKKLANKLWNIYRYIMMSINEKDLANCFEADDLELISENDKNLVKELIQCIKMNKNGFEQYQYQWGLNSLHLFWTVHLSRDFLPTIKSDNREETKIRLKLLVNATIAATKLLHPYMPHVTEFLYQKLKVTALKSPFEELDSLSNSCYPSLEKWSSYLKDN